MEIYSEKEREEKKRKGEGEEDKRSEKKKINFILVMSKPWALIEIFQNSLSHFQHLSKLSKAHSVLLPYGPTPLKGVQDMMNDSISNPIILK